MGAGVETLLDLNRHDTRSWEQWGPSGKVTATAVDIWGLVAIVILPGCYYLNIHCFFLFTPQILLGNWFYSGGFHYQSEADGMQTPHLQLWSVSWAPNHVLICLVNILMQDSQTFEATFSKQVSYIIPTDTWRTPIPIYHQSPSESATVNSC